MLIIAGARDTHQQLAAQLSNDFTGQNSFLYWIAGLGAVGAVGYAPRLETFSRVFMGLILVVLVLSNGGFFNKFLEAIQSPAGYTPSDYSVAGNASGQPDPINAQNAGTVDAARQAVTNPGGVFGQVAGQTFGQMGSFALQGIKNTFSVFGF